MSEQSWLGGTGFGGKHIDKARSESRSQPLRFFLNKGETKKILFLDDEPQWAWEHSFRKGFTKSGKPKWRRVTCRRGMDGGCPGCSSDLIRVYTGFLTILDLSGYKDKEGKVHKNIRKLLTVGIDDGERFERYVKKNDGLTGWIVETTRFNKKNARAIGDEFEFIKRVKPFEDETFFFTSKLDGGEKKPPEVYDYTKILEPMSAEDMRDFIRIDGGSYDEGGSGSDNEEGDGGHDEGGDDDVPY